MEKYSTNIYEYARRGLTNGVNIVREAVACTIGGAGRNVIIRQRDYPFYISTKDAFSITQAIHCTNPLERQAVDMMRDATDSMNKIAKDGRTAMCILTDAILQEVEKQGMDPIKAEKEINEELPSILKAIDDQSKEITEKNIEDVARTASNSDRIAKLIAEIYKEQGKECIINHIEGSGTLNDYVLYHDGVRFQGAGLLSEGFVHDEDAIKDKRVQKQAVYKKPSILVTKREVTKVEDLDPFINGMVRKGNKDLVIFLDKISPEVQTALVRTHLSGIANICVIKAPVLWKDYVFEDFAKAVGATIVDDSTGVTFKNLDMNHLGTCEKIVVDKDECILNGTKDLSEHVKELKEKGDDDSKRRVWWLTTKTATIRLGANNEGELSNLRLATQDAVYSCQAALEQGIVEGGGITLSKIKTNNPILSKALLAPKQQILQNASLKEYNYDMTHIVDATLVVKNSLRNAVAIASVILKTDKLIDIPRKSAEEIQMEMMNRQRMPY